MWIVRPFFSSSPKFILNALARTTTSHWQTTRPTPPPPSKNLYFCRSACLALTSVSNGGKTHFAFKLERKSDSFIDNWKLLLSNGTDRVTSNNNSNDTIFSCDKVNCIDFRRSLIQFQQKAKIEKKTFYGEIYTPFAHIIWYFVLFHFSNIDEFVFRRRFFLLLFQRCISIAVVFHTKHKIILITFNVVFILYIICIHLQV